MDDRGSQSGPRPIQPAPVDRAARRHKIFEPATLTATNGELRVHVLNVSATGALIHVRGGPARGERCSIALAGRTLAAEVAWVDGMRAGIAFRGTLSADELARLLG